MCADAVDMKSEQFPARCVLPIMHVGNGGTLKLLCAATDSSADCEARGERKCMITLSL